MSWLNESVVQVWHKYQNIVIPFFFSGGTYDIKKVTKKSTKAFEHFYASFFSCVVPDFVWSFQIEIYKQIPRHSSWKGTI